MQATMTTRKKTRPDAPGTVDGPAAVGSAAVGATAAPRFGLRSLIAFYVLACAAGWVLYALEAAGIVSDAMNLPLGPVIGAAIVAALLGRRGFREWWSELRRETPTATGYAVALGVPAVLAAAFVGVNALFGAPLPTADQLATSYELPVTFLAMFIAVGIGEEAGWMGFAAPVLRRKYAAAVAIAALVVMRVAWHLPLMLDGELPWFLGVVGTGSFQVILLVLARHLRGGWLIAALWHTMLNTVGGSYTFPMVEGADNARLGYIMAASYLALALVVVAADRIVAGRRARRGAPAEERIALPARAG